MKTITEKMVNWKIETLPEDMHPNDCFGLEPEDQKRVVNSILKDMQWNEWAWCMVKVTGIYNGLTSYTVLGGCNFDDEKQFIECGYFSDMQCEVLDDLNKRAKLLVESLA